MATPQPPTIAPHESAVARDPAAARSHHDVGVALAQSGRRAEGLEHLRAACRLAPESLDFVNNLGAVCEDDGLLEEAISHYQTAVRLGPHLAIPHFNLGDILRKAGRVEEALPALEQATRLDPDLPEAWESLAEAFLQHNQPDNAAIALHGHGRTLLAAGRNVEAIAALERSRMLHPLLPGVIHDHGKALFNLGCLEHAMLLLHRAADVAGRMSAAEEAGEVRSLALRHLAVFVPGSPVDDNSSIYKTRKKYIEMVTAGESRAQPILPRVRAPGPWRIGYLSSFFHAPQWMRPVWGLINRHDRERFEVHLVSASPRGAIDAAYGRHPRDRIHDISGLSNIEAAASIAAAGIDLLVDLNGYSDPQRLAIHALRPAPRQVTWFNMYGTSGMDCFDAIVGDATVAPEAEDAFSSEPVVRLPGSYLAFAPATGPDDSPVPAITPEPPSAHGPLTLGCLASSYKLTNVTLAAWAEILARSPQARLLIRNAGLDREDHRAFLKARLARLGVAPERIECLGSAGHWEFLETYGRIDLALDPFPYSGGTTTSEALWQGVPVITFTGDRWASRTSASLLRAAGLDELVASDRRGYVDLAVRLATSTDTPAMLRSFRAGIRARLLASAACDTAGLTRTMEDLYLRLLASP